MIRNPEYAFGVQFLPYPKKHPRINEGPRIDVDPYGLHQYDVWIFDTVPGEWGSSGRIEFTDYGRILAVVRGSKCRLINDPDSRQGFAMCRAIDEDGAPIEPLLDYIGEIVPEFIQPIYNILTAVPPTDPPHPAAPG